MALVKDNSIDKKVKSPVKKKILETKQKPPVKSNNTNPNASATGIKEFDRLLSGGFPEGSVVLLSGGSGSGKTIFSFQWLFEGVKAGENGLYISFTEPLFKTVKNLEKLSFYERNVIENEKIKVLDMRNIHDQEMFDVKKVIETIEKEVKKNNIKRICMDSVTAIAYSLNDKALIRKFIYDLGKILASLGVTTILISEVSEHNTYSVYGVEEFISDAIIKLDKHDVDGNILRFIEIAKVRGLSYPSDEIYFKITSDGIRTFPPLKTKLDYVSSDKKISTGITGLDEMLHGGIILGSVSLISGPTGSGKTTSSIHFITKGLEKGETCMYLAFEESKDQLIRNAKSLGFDLEKYVKNGLLIIRPIYPSDKYVDEHLIDIRNLVEKHNVKRMVVDSLSAVFDDFDHKVAAHFAKSLNAYLKANNITTYFTSSSANFLGIEKITGTELSSVADNIISFRFTEIQGELKLVMSIIKTRGASHSKLLREYTIGDKGIKVGQSLRGYEGIMSGMTRKVSSSIEEQIQIEFRKYLGPMGDTIFFELKDKGLNKSAINSYIDSITSEGILKSEDSIKFKKSLGIILG